MKDLTGWVPIRIEWQGSQPTVDWGYLGERRYSDPFFIQTINQCLQHPANLLFRHQTRLQELGEINQAHTGIAPTGFIFHMSRCGSTLLARMLAALPQNVVLSEAGPIDDVLRARFREPAVTEGQQVQWLRWIISALAGRQDREQKNLFIKLDCWHILFLPLIRRAFPSVPWIFLYREPQEVMASAQKQLGGQMIPGVLQPTLFGWDAAAVGAMPLYEYTARVLARFCEAALGQVEAGGKLANYRQLPATIWPGLLQHWNVSFSAAEMERMLEVAASDAKNPVLPFAPDSQAKRELLSPELRELTARWLDGVYEQLEARRQLIGFA